MNKHYTFTTILSLYNVASLYGNCVLETKIKEKLLNLLSVSPWPQYLMTISEVNWTKLTQ